MKLNSEFRSLAAESLKGKWAMAAVATIICIAINSGLSFIPKIGTLFTICIGLPLTWGLYIIFLEVYRGKEVDLQTLLSGFKDYGRILGTTFLMSLYSFLWSLLLIIPGIVKGYSYAMTAYILKDNPELEYNEAIEKSMAMMSGYKMKLFLLDLSFLGWIILSIITLGLGLFLLIPYMYTSRAAFYEDLKAELEGTDAVKKGTLQSPDKKKKNIMLPRHQPSGKHDNICSDYHRIRSKLPSSNSKVTTL